MGLLKRLLFASVVATALCVVRGGKGRKAHTASEVRHTKMRAALADKKAGGKKPRAASKVGRPAFAKGSQTVEAQQHKVELKQQQTAAYDALLSYCETHDVGAKAALKGNARED